MPHRVETYSPIMTQPAIAPAYSPYAIPPPSSAKARREPYGTSPSPSEGDRRPVCTPPAEAPVAYTGYGYASGHDERTPAPYAYAVYGGYPAQHYPLHTYQAPPPPAGKGAGAGVQIIHTDDAATKLSDRVRRRCFNCCSTDTSTWRRSTLSPGKVLCNKCGLFERTHSRPRPAQFPHKRGPLASSTLKRAQPYPPPATHYATNPLPSPSPSAKPASNSAQPPSSGKQERDAGQHE